MFKQVANRKVRPIYSMVIKHANATTLEIIAFKSFQTGTTIYFGTTGDAIIVTLANSQKENIYVMVMCQEKPFVHYNIKNPLYTADKYGKRLSW